MASDVLLLTGLLYFTGGQTNPFSFLYLIHLALAAIVLRAWWTWSLVGLSLVCFGALFFCDSGLAAQWFAHPEAHAMHMRMHMQGMWIGFGIASAFIVYFLTRVTSDLAHREAELAGARAQAVRSEKLASLATLAAGAAHELATPLSTIAVVAVRGLLGAALVVDDDDTLRERLARVFRERGYEVRTAGGYDQAVAAAREDSPEFAIVDLRMPGPGGLDVVRDLEAIDSETRIVVLTGYGSIATTVEAMRLGAVHYLQKPADADEIIAAFARSDTQSADAGDTDFSVPSLERVKWEHINRVLTDSAGNVSEAARKLGMHRRTLQRLLQKYPPRE